MKNKNKKFYLWAGIAVGVITGGLLGFHIGYNKHQEYIAAGRILDDAIKEDENDND